jgi:hypothetical protein
MFSVLDDTIWPYWNYHGDFFSSPGDFRISEWSFIWFALPGAGAVTGFLKAHNGDLYAGTEFSWGDVYKSTDGGDSWYPTSDMPGIVATSGPIEASDGNIYVFGITAAEEQRIYRTANSGGDWTLVSSGMGWGGFLEGADSCFYALYCTTRVEPLGVLKSCDYGATWDTVLNAPVAFLLATSEGGVWAFGHEIVYRSFNGGGEWKSVHVPFDIWFPVEASDGGVYGWATDNVIWRTTDRGLSWDSLSESGESSALDFFQDSQGAFYVSGNTGLIRRSGDTCRTWDRFFTHIHPGGLKAGPLIELTDGTLLCGAHGPYWEVNPNIFRYHPDRFYRSAVLYSSVYMADTIPAWGPLSWDATLNGGLVELKARSDSARYMYGAMNWDSCEAAVNGQDLSELSSVRDGDRYLQYRLELWSNADSSQTPLVHEVRVEYEPAVGIEYSGGIGGHAPSPPLLRVWPNPFSGTTRVSCSFTGGGHARLAVYDITGRLIRILLEGETQPHESGVSWDGRDDSGEALPSGIYFLRLEEEGEGSASKKVVLLE